jgi:hypothetical protein
MSKFPILFDSLFFEVRYASGHLYLDRCGLCLLDIERQCEGWLASTASPQGSKMERPDKLLSLTYSSQVFNVALQKAYKQDVNEAAKEADLLWRIIQANLGLEEYLRIGCRFQYLLPSQSIKDAERLAAKSDFNVLVPANILQSGFTLQARQSVAVLKHDSTEYRVQLGTVTRQEGIDPSSLLQGDPRFLSQKQDKFRLDQLKVIQEYSANPLYGVVLDVDCSAAKPQSVLAKEFILDQHQVVTTTFFPILEKLWHQQ